MTVFKELTNLPCFDLEKELEELLSNNAVSWGHHGQICINTTSTKLDDYHAGAGSLWYDWDNVKKENGKLDVPVRTVPLAEEDFTHISSPFVGTSFEEIVNQLKKYYLPFYIL